MIRTPEGQALKNAGSGRRWPLIIIGLISLNMCIVAVTVICANSDKSFAIEPDYYKKALDWDRTATARDRGAALGWNVAVTLAEPRKDSSKPVMRVSLQGPASADGQSTAPLDGAQIQVEAFAQARSGQRVAIDPVGVGGGIYEADAPITRAGLWEVRLKIKRGPDSLSFVRTLLVQGSLGNGGDR